MRKRLILIFASIFSVASIAFAGKPGNITVMSYNIRIMTAQDGTNSWEYRYPASAMMIDEQKPDIIGLQEPLIAQVNYLVEVCKGYKFIGVGCDDGKKKGGVNAILYNSKTMSVLKNGTFWLSDTPDKASKGWDGAYFRAATWAVMKEKESGQKVFVVNTHLDNEGTEAREKGLELIISKIAELNTDNCPVILTGDFNMQPNDSAMSSVKKSMKDTRETAFSTDHKGTFHNWGKQKTDMIIDYIWYSGFDSCTSYETVTKEYYKRAFISDHYPIKATFVL